MKVTREEVLRFLSYNPESGAFTRIAAGSAKHVGLVGKPAGHINKVTGYVEIQVCGRKHYGHRLAWLVMTGVMADHHIDHANRDRADNRWGNLRRATHADNLRNSKLRVDNTSGVKGVTFDGKRGKWAASLGRRYIGRFDTLEAAANARHAAATAAYGEFANETAVSH